MFLSHGNPDLDLVLTFREIQDTVGIERIDNSMLARFNTGPVHLLVKAVVRELEEHR
jgi:hypothetical protein